MPHVTLEYTANLSALDVAHTLAAVNQALVDSGEFGEPDIKSRALRLDQFQVGVLPVARGFVHLEIALLSGRSTAQRKALADAALAALLATVAPVTGVELQFSVETVELHRDSYAKSVRHA